MKDYIYNNLIQKNGQLNSAKIKNDGAWLKKDNETIFNFINAYIGRTLTEKLFLFVNDITEIPLCEECQKNPIAFWGFKNGYRNYKFCSNSCAAKSKKTQEKIKNTMKFRYGVEHALQSN